MASHQARRLNPAPPYGQWDTVLLCPDCALTEPLGDRSLRRIEPLPAWVAYQKALAAKKAGDAEASLLTAQERWDI